jgi:hypothetical protein
MSVNVTAAFIGARPRWQAEEIKKAAEAEKREATEALEKTKATLKDASGRLVREEPALRKSMLKNAPRREAWSALFAIFTIINFVGPYAISRLLEKWRSDRASAKVDAEVGHHARVSGELLRGSRGTQKSRAMRFFAAAIDKLSKEGMPVDVLNQIKGAEVAAAAAERSDRNVNPGRFFKLSRS